MTPTEQYLKEVIKSGEENTLIYDERAKKLNYIKEYMESEEVGYEEAALVVNQIEAMDSRPKQKAVLKEEPQAEAKD